MAGIKGLVTLAFTGSVGTTLLLLACALPEYGKWWPLFVVVFYLLAPLPTLMARQRSEGAASSPLMETAIFLTMGVLISSFALPILLARCAVIKWGACMLTVAGNVVIYLTILGFFTIYGAEDSDYAAW